MEREQFHFNLILESTFFRRTQKKNGNNQVSPPLPSSPSMFQLFWRRDIRSKRTVTELLIVDAKSRLGYLYGYGLVMN
jgi:hypothetical protein